MSSKPAILAALTFASLSGVISCTSQDTITAQPELAHYQESVLRICDGGALSSAEVVFVKGENHLTETNLSWGGTTQQGSLHNGIRSAEHVSTGAVSDPIFKGKILDPGATIEVGENGFISLLVGDSKKTINLQPNTRTFLQCGAAVPIASANTTWLRAFSPMKASVHQIPESYLSAAVRG